MNNIVLKNEFPLDEDLIYLNHAAVAPWPTRTLNAIKNFANENNHQGATHYPNWVITEQQTKDQLRQLINAGSSDEIAFLKNTSEALSVIAFGLDWQAGDNIVTSNQEFPSNRIVWESLSNQGVVLKQADLADAASPEQALINQVDNNTRLLTISSVQYASGLKMDLQVLGDFCKKNNILFCVDAIQSIGAVQFDVQNIHADFVMADAHKWMLAPEGIALFYCRKDKRDLLQLKQYGWHMIENHLDYNTPEWEIANSSRRFECGSPNMLGIHALNASLSLLLEYGMENIENELLNKVNYLHDKIATLADYEIVSNITSGRIAGIIIFRHKSKDQSELFQYLKQNNVVCAERGGGIRFSPHFYTSDETLDKAIEILTAYT